MQSSEGVQAVASKRYLCTILYGAEIEHKDNIVGDTNPMDP